MRILAIETSCDETGIALLEASDGLRSPKFRVVKNLVASQIKIHRPFGGVVPNLAKREHLKNLPILFAEMAGGPTKSARAKNFMAKIDFVTVTVGPGLEPALWTGINFAQTLAKEFKKPLVGANHLEGHLYSFLLTKQKIIFPAVALIVSGGHTTLLRVESFSKWKRLGETRDDAAGEAFDKVARLLDLPYPGGPEIEKLAAREAKNRAHPGGTIAFPRPMLADHSYDFSFSGLKTAVLYYFRDNPKASKQDIAASFQTAALDVLVAKTIRATKEAGGAGSSTKKSSAGRTDARSIILCGGVAANKALRDRLARAAREAGCVFLVPDFKYNLDNAAMIGAAGYFARLRRKKFPFRANGGLEI